MPVYNSEGSAALLPPKHSVEEDNGRYTTKIIPRRPNPGKTIDFSISKIMNRAHRASAIAKPWRTPLFFFGTSFSSKPQRSAVARIRETPQTDGFSVR